MDNEMLSEQDVFGKTTFEKIASHVDKNEAFFGFDSNLLGRTEGYDVGEGGSPIFATKYADEYHLQAFYHELAHALDFVNDPDRILKPYFRMNYMTKVEVYGKEYEQPTTAQGILTECRAFAIQAKLTSITTGIEGSVCLKHILHSLRSVRLMEDFINIPIENVESLTYDETIKERINWCEERTSKIFSILDPEDLKERISKFNDVRNYLKWSTERLLEESYHIVYVNDLYELINPMARLSNSIADLNDDEVYQYAEKFGGELVEIPHAEVLPKDLAEEQIDEIRLAHLKCIAYYYNREPKKLTMIDLKKSDGEFIATVDDNHRLIAQKMKNRKLTYAKINGAVDDIYNSNLWGPNVFLEEVHRRQGNTLRLGNMFPA